MPNLNVHNLDDNVYKSIRLRAAEQWSFHGRRSEMYLNTSGCITIDNRNIS